MTIKLDREQRERALALEDEMSDADTFGEYAFELIALRDEKAAIRDCEHIYETWINGDTGLTALACSKCGTWESKP